VEAGGFAFLTKFAFNQFFFSRADGVVDNSEASGLLRATKGFGKRGIRSH
jgi:hypothetical protein